MPELVEHRTINGKYKIIFEKAAGVKTGDGFKVECCGDDMEALEKEITRLYDFAKSKAEVING